MDDKSDTKSAGTSTALFSINKVSFLLMPSVFLNFTYTCCELTKETCPVAV
jgi:hypothetical protein